MNNEENNLNSENLEPVKESISNDSFNKALEDKIEKQTNKALIKSDKKKKKKVIIISVTIIVILAILGVLYYITNNPRFIMKTAINKAFNSLQNETIYDYEQGTLSLNLDDKNSENNLAIDFEYQADNKQGLFDVTANIIVNAEPSIDIYMNQDKDKFSFYAPDLYDGYLSYDMQAEPFSDMSVETNAIHEALTETINSEKIIGDNINITVNNENVKTKRSSLTIDNSNIESITTTFANSLKNNQEFIDTLVNDYDVSEDEVLEAIDSLITDTTDYPITISIYTKGLKNDFVKFEVSAQENNDVIYGFSITKISDNNIEYQFISNESTNNEINGNLNIKNENTITTDFTITEDGMVTYEGTLQLDGEINEIDSYEAEEVTESTNIEDLSDEDLEQLYINLFMLLYYTMGDTSLEEDYTDDIYYY